MPPKVRITKDEIIRAAVELVRLNGEREINARTLAKQLNCSTQPIFSNFATMEDVRDAVLADADARYREYTEREIKSARYPTYKATGMAYIRFAAEEKELFKLLFMRDRSAEPISAFPKEISDIVQNTTGFSEKSAERFHLEMWTYVHGIATMTATDYLALDTELVSEMLTDAYYGLKSRYQTKEEAYGCN